MNSDILEFRAGSSLGALRIPSLFTDQFLSAKGTSPGKTNSFLPDKITMIPAVVAATAPVKSGFFDKILQSASQAVQVVDDFAAGSSKVAKQITNPSEEERRYIMAPTPLTPTGAAASATANASLPTIRIDNQQPIPVVPTDKASILTKATTWVKANPGKTGLLALLGAGLIVGGVVIASSGSGKAQPAAASQSKRSGTRAATKKKTTASTRKPAKKTRNRATPKKRVHARSISKSIKV
jgi:hypothetical protein